MNLMTTLIPKSRIEVATKFFLQAQAHGWNVLAVSEDGKIAKVKHKDNEFNVMFELKASDLNLLDERVATCGLLICWESDKQTAPLTILDLKDAAWHTKPYKYQPASLESVMIAHLYAVVEQKEKRISELEDQIYALTFNNKYNNR